MANFSSSNASDSFDFSKTTRKLSKDGAKAVITLKEPLKYR